MRGLNGTNSDGRCVGSPPAGQAVFGTRPAFCGSHLVLAKAVHHDTNEFSGDTNLQTGRVVDTTYDEAKLGELSFAYFLARR